MLGELRTAFVEQRACKPLLQLCAVETPSKATPSCRRGSPESILGPIGLCKLMPAAYAFTPVPAAPVLSLSISGSTTTRLGPKLCIIGNANQFLATLDEPLRFGIPFKRKLISIYETDSRRDRCCLSLLLDQHIWHQTDGHLNKTHSLPLVTSLPHRCTVRLSMRVPPYVPWHWVGKQHLSRQSLNCLQVKRRESKATLQARAAAKISPCLYHLCGRFPEVAERLNLCESLVTVDEADKARSCDLAGISK